MAQGPGARSPLADSEVLLWEPSTQLLLPASPWLPAETLLPQPLGGKSSLPIRLKHLIEDEQRASPSKEVPFP